MNTSEPSYNVIISFLYMPERVQLFITNGLFEVVYNEIANTVTINIPKGLYTIKATYIDYCQEYMMVVEQDSNFTYEFHYPSVAPALPFKTTHEYFSGPAEYYSQIATNTKQYNVKNEINFLLFGAKYDKDSYPGMIAAVTVRDYYITAGGGNEDESFRIDFSSDNSQSNNEFGWFAHSCCLNEGLYFLNYDDGEKKRLFPFYIFEDFQTQFFIRYSTRADLDNAFFYYSQEAFNRNDPKYLVLDKIIHIYMDYKNYELLTSEDKNIIKKEPYLTTLLKILFILLEKPDEFDESSSLLLPDIILLTHSEKESTDLLPILSVVMSKFAIYNGVFSFKPGSLMDRTVDNLYFDLFWNNFSQIENPENWKNSYTSLIEESKNYVTAKADGMLLKMSKYIRNNYTKAGREKDQKLGTLLGTSDTLQNFNNTIKSIGNIGVIAETLNVPPTKIMRNYETYNKIYEDITRK